MSVESRQRESGQVLFEETQEALLQPAIDYLTERNPGAVKTAQMRWGFLLVISGSPDYPTRSAHWEHIARLDHRYEEGSEERIVYDLAVPLIEQQHPIHEGYPSESLPEIRAFPVKGSVYKADQRWWVIRKYSLRNTE